MWSPSIPDHHLSYSQARKFIFFYSFLFFVLFYMLNLSFMLTDYAGIYLSTNRLSDQILDTYDVNDDSLLLTDYAGVDLEGPISDQVTKLLDKLDDVAGNQDTDTGHVTGSQDGEQGTKMLEIFA